MSEQIIENTEMPMEGLIEPEIAQNDEQSPAMNNETTNDPSGGEPIRWLCDRCGNTCQGPAERACAELFNTFDPLAAHVDRIFSHYEATDIAPTPNSFGDGMEFEMDQTNFVANIFDAFVGN